MHHRRQGMAAAAAAVVVVAAASIVAATPQPQQQQQQPAAAAIADLTARLRRSGDLAGVFRREAVNYTGMEVLRQRASVTKWKAFHRQPEVSLETREIVSEYGYGTLAEEPGALLEFRKVVSVDNQPVTARVKARETLIQGIASRDDRLRRQLLRDFAAHGLQGAIAGFGQVIALFDGPRLAEYDYQPRGKTRVGPDEVLRLAYRQKQGTAGLLTVFEGHKAVHQPLEGEIWLRAGDSSPARVVVVSMRRSEDRNPVPIRDETAVDYAINAAGVPLPAAVVHRQWVDGRLVLEDVFEYSEFKRFSADAVIQFSVDPQP